MDQALFQAYPSVWGVERGAFCVQRMVLKVLEAVRLRIPPALPASRTRPSITGKAEKSCASSKISACRVEGLGFRVEGLGFRG